MREAEGRRGKERRKVVERVVACSYSTCSIVNLCQKIILTISVGNNILRVYYTALEPLITDHSKQTPLYLLPMLILLVYLISEKGIYYHHDTSMSHF